MKNGLPDIDWIEILAGTFKFGEKKRNVKLEPFGIARYLVTNAQFQCFINDGGYQHDQWWDWPEERRMPATPGWPYPNHPRETVSWFEAMAFCKWLKARLGRSGRLGKNDELRLPTEQQWERATRGEDGREYPWGDEYVAGAANIDETDGAAGPYFLEQTSAVGIYPAGASSCGALDMSGNVWEWCSDKREPDEKGDLVRKVLRGGSWSNFRDSARASYRFDVGPDNRRYDLGFRVLCVSPIR